LVIVSIARESDEDEDVDDDLTTSSIKISNASDPAFPEFAHIRLCLFVSLHH
jgi:hypothetical protein